MAKAFALPLPAGSGVTGRLWRKIQGPADLVLADAAASGEGLAARIRVHVAALLLALQLVPAWPEGLGPRIDVSIAALAAALVLRQAASRTRAAWFGYATSALDVSLVSAALALQTVNGAADAPWRSVSGFPLYFLALALASLRMNWRVSAFAGVAAVAQYAALLGFTVSRFAPDVALMPQVARLATLAAAGYLGAVVVLRAQQLQNLSTTDFLTGLANRATLEARMSQELSRARRHERKFAVALVDADAFKAFNDTFGHPRGDLALQALASLMQSTARDSDLVARFGGEEFAILMPETGVLEAHAKLEALRARVEASDLVPGTRAMTFTAGIATFPADGPSAAELLASADARLYVGKSEGRNRVVSSSRRATAITSTGPEGRSSC